MGVEERYPEGTATAKYTESKGDLLEFGRGALTIRIYYSNK